MTHIHIVIIKPTFFSPTKQKTNRVLLLYRVNPEVRKASTNTNLTFAKSGNTLNFTAAVSAVSPGTGNHSGTVNFYDGVTKIGTGTLIDGKDTFSKSNLNGHSIKAIYGGDNNFPTTNSNIVKP